MREEMKDQVQKKLLLLDYEDSNSEHMLGLRQRDYVAEYLIARKFPLLHGQGRLHNMKTTMKMCKEGKSSLNELKKTNLHWSFKGVSPILKKQQCLVTH